MHADQVDVPLDVVTRLVASQFPQWRRLPIRPVASDGTVNALFRLGDEVVLRFPLQPSLAPALRDELVREQATARRLAGHLPLPVPEPLGLGEPGEGYAGPWAAYGWIPGEPASVTTIGDERGFACTLADFVSALHDVDTEGRTWDGTGRGGPLSTRDASVRRSLDRSAHLTDTAAVGRAWDVAAGAPAYSGPDRWVHADLMPGNLLVRDGRLTAVIDLGTVTVGDPAVDLMPAWNLLSANARAAYRERLGVDDAEWERGRGWAIAQAIGALPYYVDTNPAMAKTARQTLRAVLTDA